MTAMEDVPQGVVILGMPCKLVTNVQYMEGCIASYLYSQLLSCDKAKCLH